MDGGYGLKKRRTEFAPVAPSRYSAPSQVIGDWEAEVKATIYQPRPIAGWRKPTTKKRSSKK
jgi:hypothetical protein